MTTTDADAGELQRRLRRMIELESLDGVSERLGISREALARYLADLPVQPGTLSLIETRLNRPSTRPVRAERQPTARRRAPR